MMSDFENRRCQIVLRCLEQIGLACGLSITRKQKGDLPVGELQHERGVVQVRRLGIAPQHSKLHGPEGNAIATLGFIIGRFCLSNRVQELLKGASGMHCTRCPHRANRQGVQHLNQPTDMIRVGVGGDHEIDALDLLIAQVRQGLTVIVPAINQGGGAIGCLDQDTIPLTNINDMHREGACVGGRSMGRL